MRWKIPAFDGVYEKGWRQPEGLRERVVLYQKPHPAALIKHEDWQQLLNYEGGQPRRVKAGKVWRSGKYLCWYGPKKICPVTQQPRWAVVVILALVQ